MEDENLITPPLRVGGDEPPEPFPDTPEEMAQAIVGYLGTDYIQPKQAYSTIYYTYVEMGYDLSYFDEVYALVCAEIPSLQPINQQVLDVQTYDGTTLIKGFNNGKIYLKGIGNYEGSTINEDNKSVQDAVIENINGVKKIWQGSESDYSGLTKEANTLYMIY